MSIACQAVLLALTAPLYVTLGFSIAWETILPNLVLPSLLIGVWVHHQLVPDRRKGAFLNDVIFAVLLMMLLTNILAPAQYFAVALDRPLVDHWLAAADAALGFHVPSLVSWTREYPIVEQMLKICYFSLLPQFLLAPIVAGLVLRNRERLWEYVFHFHFCAIVTLACLLIVPASCAFAYYGVEPTPIQAGFIHQFRALREGSLATIHFNDLEGLVSMPSFHAAGAMMVTWAFRGYRWWLLPLALINVGLIAATIPIGAHFFVDVLGAGVVFLASLIAFRLIGQRWVPGRA